MKKPVRSSPRPAGREKPAAQTESPPRPLKRLNYFSGRLLSPEDLTAEQEYHRDRLRRHNRYLHGWGIVSGLELSLSDGELVVAGGFALDCHGDELILPAPILAPLPACPPAPRTLFVLLSMSDEFTDPVPVPGEGAPDAPSMASSRILEGSQLSLAPEDPGEGHARSGDRSTTCGESHGVALGRLVWGPKRWQIDKAYRPGRARA